MEYVFLINVTPSQLDSEESVRGPNYEQGMRERTRCNMRVREGTAQKLMKSKDENKRSAPQMRCHLKLVDSPTLYF